MILKKKITTTPAPSPMNWEHGNWLVGRNRGHGETAMIVVENFLPRPLTIDLIDKRNLSFSLPAVSIQKALIKIL